MIFNFTQKLLSLPLAIAAALGPHTSSSNFAADILGYIDTRPGCWGYAGAQAWTVTFNPPPGFRVRILKLRGDLVAWPRVLPGESPVAPGSYAGVLLGFTTTAPEGSNKCDLCADNTMVYIQDALMDKPVRTPFQYDIDQLLELDHKLVVKVASWLNTTGKPIHIEPTFTVVYQFEPESGAPVQAKPQSVRVMGVRP